MFCKNCDADLDTLEKHYKEFCNNSCQMKFRWKDPSFRDKISTAATKTMRANHQDPVWSERNSKRSKDTMTKQRKDPNFIKALSASREIMNAAKSYCENNDLGFNVWSEKVLFESEIL